MPFRFDERTREELARAIYENHVARKRTNQDPGRGREGPVPYERLSEEEREANRRRADDMGTKLELIGASAVPLDAADPGAFEFTSEELERLSRHEHARWMHEKLQAGWQFGPTIDAVAHTHPCLVSYDRLSGEEREKDRQAVQRIPLLLRAVGLQIVRRGGSI
jgi:hypothetical protein